MTINKCEDDVSEKKILKYKFSYFKKREDILSGHNKTSEEEIIIQEWSKYSEVLYQFPELNPQQENKYYIRGYCMDEFGVYDSEIQEVEVFDIPTNSKKDIPLEESIESIDLDEELTSEQLLKRAEFLATATVDYEKEVEILNRTNITIYNKQGLLQDKLILNDPTSSERDLYCNYRGNSYVEYLYLICDCNGYDGNMCQIDHNSYDYMIDIYNKLFDKIKTMQTGNYNMDLILSLNLLMKSAATFMDVENMDFMLESIDFINLHRNKFVEKMMEDNNYEIYFDIYNSLIEYGLSIVNKLKYKNYIKQNAKNADNLYNFEKFRNASLAKGDPEIVQNFFNKIKISLQDLLEFYASNRKDVRFINKNINVYVSLIDENFAFNSFFELEKKLYEPYFDFQRCLEKTMIQSIGNPSYRLYLTSIIWKVSPYMSDEELYRNTTSPVVSFNFLDYDTGEKIYLSDCGNKESQVQIYFPINNYNLVEKINEKKDYLSPEDQYALNDGIFCDPVYINKSGAVFNISLEERRNKFFLGFNFSCKYYLINSEDQNNIILTTETLDYNDYTNENYIQCLSNKLMQESYGEFVVDSYLIPAEFHLNSRFFYLKHYKLLSWKDNYTNNQAFYYHLILSVTYIGLSIIYIYFEKSNYIKVQRLGELKKEITKLNLPYRDEYIFNNDLQIGEEIRGKLKDKRKPNMEEMNLDTNNLNVGIMADEIGKYNKGFKRKQLNTVGFSPVYFGIKENNKSEINTKFFPEEIDIRTKATIPDDVPSEKFDKMKKFYQVGFKGLDPNEKNKKEIQLSQDKKRVLVQKQQNLSKIIETKEDDDLEIYIGRNRNLFKKSEKDEMIKTNERKIENNDKKENTITDYKEFLSNDRSEQQTQIKSEKREKSKKMFFSPNPPKKETNNVGNSINFTGKEQQKTVKSDSPFFSDNNLEVINKNKRKQKIIFQQDHESSYKPNFRGPKFISENLGFFTKETIDFEQTKDIENKNPPYYGSRFDKISPKVDEKVKNENAGMKVGFYYKNRQIDFIEDEEKLPELADNLTFEKKMEEFHDYPISFKRFLIKNLSARHILFTTFDRMSIVYARYMRAGNFAAQLSMFAFFLSIFFVNDEKQTALETKEQSQIINLVLYCFISDILGCIVVHLPAYFFWVNDKKFRKLYNTILIDGGINVLKLTEEIIKKGRIFWNILGIIIQLFYILIGFYFSFGFCATYSYQKSTFFFALICTCVFDFLVAEFLWEIIIGILFYLRDFGRLIVFLGTIFNTLRNIKHLV